MPVRNPSPMSLLLYWIKEREEIRKRKEELEEEPPWTDDEILQTYRFCNVRREDDQVTRWIAEHWRKPYQQERHLWFAMTVARLFNLPTTLEEIGFPVPWNPRRTTVRLAEIKEAGEKVFNSAYIVSTNGRKMEKVQYLTTEVLNPLWEDRLEIAPKRGDHLQTFHARLSSYNGLGSFMAAQVVADLKYADEQLKVAMDWNTFAASGPGSRRGLNRLLSRPVNNPWREKEWHGHLLEVRKIVNEKCGFSEPLHAQDIQNCLCEYDKYIRVRNNEGRPKQKYPGA